MFDSLSPTAAKRSVMPTGPRRRFSVAPCIDGYEVVDQDGRSVSNAYEHANTPLEKAAELNEAAAVGPVALRRALNAVYDDDLDSVYPYFDDDFDYAITEDVGFIGAQDYA